MQHARHTYVANVAIGAIKFPGHIVARDRLANHLVLGNGLELGLHLDVEWVANALVPLDLAVEVFATDQIGIADRFARVCDMRHHAVVNPQLVCGHAQFCGGQFHQNTTGFCRCAAQGLGTRLNAQGAGGTALVHRTGRISHHDLDLVVSHIQLFGDDLANGHIQTLAQVHLAVISGHFAIGLNGHP